MDINVLEIRPPFDRGRIFSYRAEKSCTMRIVEIFIDSVNNCFVEIWFSHIGKEGKRISEFLNKRDPKSGKVPEIKTINLEESDSVIFHTVDVQGVDHIDIKLKITKYSGPVKQSEPILIEEKKGKKGK